METVELRLMFVAGLVLLGGLALVAGFAFSRLTELLRGRAEVPDHRSADVRIRLQGEAGGTLVNPAR